MSPLSFPPRLSYGAQMALGVTLASLLAGGLAIHSVLASRKAAFRLAEIQSQNLAQALDQTVSATFTRIDHTLVHLSGVVERNLDAGPKGRANIQKALDLAARTLPEVVAFRVSDAQGSVILNNPSDDPSVNFRDRPFFPVLKAHPEAGLFITKPLIGKFTGEWVITSARRFNRPDGTFGGVVVAPVRVSQFERLLKGYDVGPAGLLTLRDADGGFVARHREVVKGRVLAIGDRTISPELRALLDSGTPATTYEATTPFDQTRRIFSFRRLAQAPYVVLAGFAEDDILGQWRRDRNTTILLVGGFLVISWGMAWRMTLLWRAHQDNLASLQASEQTFRSLVETAQELIWRCDAGGRITYLNPTWAETHGRPIQELLGQTFACLQSTDTFRRDLTHFWHRAAGAPVREYETTHLTRDGRSLTLLFNAVPLRDADGRVLGTQGTAIDITSRRQTELEQERLRAQLHQSQKLESLGSLAGGVAHDMNNVLGAIIGIASVQQEVQAPGSPAHKAFQTILAAAERGAQMVRSLLGFARRAPAERRSVQLNDLLREQAALLSRTTLAKVRIDLHLAPDLPAIEGDAAALSHALMNLCVNAVDAMPEGGTLTLQSRPVSDGEVEVCVADTGSGIPLEFQERVLEPYFTTKPQGKGTGLGLSIVHGTITAHGGRLEIHSLPGQGTTMRLRFPAAAPEACPPVEAAPPPGPARARPLSVLVVDDDPLMQEGIAAVLSTLGHKLTPAHSGEAALAHLADGPLPDLILLDINMPGIGGKAVLKTLRRTHPQLPVIVVSGRIDPDLLDLVAGDPHTTLMPKPFTLHQLQAHLRTQ